MSCYYRLLERLFYFRGTPYLILRSGLCSLTTVELSPKPFELIYIYIYIYISFEDIRFDSCEIFRSHDPWEKQFFFIRKCNKADVVKVQLSHWSVKLRFVTKIVHLVSLLLYNPRFCFLKSQKK